MNKLYVKVNRNPSELGMTLTVTILVRTDLFDTNCNPNNFTKTKFVKLLSETLNTYKLKDTLIFSHL